MNSICVVSERLEAKLVGTDKNYFVSDALGSTRQVWKHWTNIAGLSIATHKPFGSAIRARCRMVQLAPFFLRLPLWSKAVRVPDHLDEIAIPGVSDPRRPCVDGGAAGALQARTDQEPTPSNAFGPSLAHLRHWVATTSRRAGLSKQATAYLMGHDAAQGGAMRDWYDNPQLRDIFDEQAARLPYGPLGLLEPPTVELEGGLSKEVVSLASAYLAGQIGTMEFAIMMEKIKLQRSTQQAPTMET